MANELRIQVSAGQHTRQWCPVCTTIPMKLVPTTGIILRDALGHVTPGQVMQTCCMEEGSCVSWLIDDLPALSTREYVLQTIDTASADVVSLVDDGAGKVDVTVAGEPFTTYNYLGNPARPCFFPLLGPGGTRVTRSWPIDDSVAGEMQDHHHHRSMWVAHGDVNGVDNWSEDQNHGLQLHTGFTKLISGPVVGVLEATNDWTDTNKKKLCEDTRRMTVYAQPDGSRLFDFDVTLTASEGDLKLGDTKEGGILALRVATSLDGSHGGTITNSHGGRMEGECWGKRASWCDYSGLVNGALVGAALMDHPTSFRYPTYWHVRNYGMYTANPFGLHDFTDDPAIDGSYLLPAGQSIKFFYRVYLHRGGVEQARVSERYHDFANPPKVKVLAE